MKSRKALAILSVLLAFVLSVAMTACNGDKPEPAVEYTVTFDANGGTLTGDSTVKVKSGEKISGAPTAAKAGQTFEAWYDAATGGTKIALDTYTVSGDVTLYAHYNENTTPTPSGVKVTFDANGGKFDGDKATVEKNADKDGLVLDLDDPTFADHRFLGWFTAKTGGEEVDIMFDGISEETTLYAHWIRQYTVTFNAGEGKLEGSATVKVDEGGKIASAPTATKDGLDFQGWYTSSDGGDKIVLETYTVSDDVTLHAHYGNITMPMKNLKNQEGQKVGYRIEAEEARFAGELGSGNNTGSPVETVETASGGKSIGYLNVVGNTVTFTFKSAAAGKATISLRATSNNTQFPADGNWMNMWVDDQTVSTADFTVKMNDAAVNFESAKLRGAGKDKPMTWNLYWDPISFGELDVVEGFNSLVITVAAQTVPNMDCLDIETSLTLTSANDDAASGEATLPAPPAPDVVYEKAVTGKLIVVDHAEGPAIQKAVLGFTEDIPAAAIATNPFKVGNVGNSSTDKVYLSDENGNKVAEGTTSARYVTIEYAYSIAASWFGTGPADNVKPFTYNQQTGKNSWNAASAYTLSVNGLTLNDTTYTKFGGTFTAQYDIPELEKWDTTGSYTDGEITLKYAHFTPADTTKTGKKPLIVWLHGAGEGGTDPSIVLLGNQVVNLGKPLIQKYFTTDTCAGAYVLAPQSPTMWMDSGNGEQGGSDVGNSIYTESLFKLIQKFVTDHTDIDADRVYIGGCSNGGWMTIEMLSKHGEYFAAAYPIAVPFDKTAGMTDEEFARLVNVPMWITHAKADMTVSVGTTRNEMWQPVFNGYTETNSNSLYIELLKAGATNVHYSLFDNVVIADGEDKTPQGAAYDGHYSWIYTLRDECSKVQATVGSGTDGAFVLADITETSNNTVTLTEGGDAVTLWGWIAAQTKTAA